MESRVIALAAGISYLMSMVVGFVLPSKPIHPGVIPFGPCSNMQVYILTLYLSKDRSISILKELQAPLLKKKRWVLYLLKSDKLANFLLG